MNLEKMHFFNRHEKIAILKLIIKLAAVDNKFTKEERASIQEFLKMNQLKISKDFTSKVINEKYEEIVSVFISKSNIKKAYAIMKNYANLHGINPEFEGKALDEIKNAMELRKKDLKVSFGGFLKDLLMEFSFLWGKEDINPNAKTILAIVFTVFACGFGSLWTSGGFFGIGQKTSFEMPQGSAVIAGLFIYGALCFRNYLPKPTKFQNILFSVANIYLLAIIAMHILGRGGFEKSYTLFVFFGLMLLLWLGMKELLGFALIGFFVLLIVKIYQADIHMAWRAFPFIVSAFMGINFQSNNFFNEFSNLSSSFFKKPDIEKELVKESLQLAGARVKKVAKTAVSVGAAAAGLPPGAIDIAKPSGS